MIFNFKLENRLGRGTVRISQSIFLLLFKKSFLPIPFPSLQLRVGENKYCLCEQMWPAPWILLLLFKKL